MSFLKFKAKNHPQQVAARGADDGVDERITSPCVFDPINAIHKFTLDAAANAANSRCSKFFTLADDGLSRSWAGERVWCNPPFSNLGSWVAKAISEVEIGGCEVVVMLLPANRCEQKWWQDNIEPRRDRLGGGDDYKHIVPSAPTTIRLAGWPHHSAEGRPPSFWSRRCNDHAKRS